LIKLEKTAAGYFLKIRFNINYENIKIYILEQIKLKGRVR